MAKRIIPCLDVKEGRVVKGAGFVDLKDAGDPVELACFYDQAGADELVLLDITPSLEKQKMVLDLAEKIVKKTSIPLIVGGGINKLDQVQSFLRAGADKVSLNTAAVTNPDFITEAAQQYGSRRLVIAIDVSYSKKVRGWEVFTHGGRTSTGRNVLDWAREVEKRGAGEILLTSMNRDGGKDGFDLEITAAVAETVQIPVIASGGAGTLEHFWQVLTKGKADAALAASVFHYQSFSVREVKDYLVSRGVEVRGV